MNLYKYDILYLLNFSLNVHFNLLKFLFKIYFTVNFLRYIQNPFYGHKEFCKIVFPSHQDVKCSDFDFIWGKNYF